MCMPSVAATVGVPVCCCICWASRLGFFTIICMPKCVRTAISGVVSSMIFAASAVVMCPFHGLSDGRKTQRMRMRTSWYGLLMSVKYSLSEVYAKSPALDVIRKPTAFGSVCLACATDICRSWASNLVSGLASMIRWGIC